MQKYDIFSDTQTNFIFLSYLANLLSPIAQRAKWG